MGWWALQTHYSTGEITIANESGMLPKTGKPLARTICTGRSVQQATQDMHAMSWHGWPDLHDKYGFCISVSGVPAVLNYDK